MDGTVTLLDFSEVGLGAKSKSKFSNRVARISLLLGCWLPVWGTNSRPDTYFSA